MTPLPFTWPYAAVFWLLFAWAYYPEYLVLREARRAPSGSSSGAADPSFRPLVVGQQIVVFLAALAAFVPRFTMRTDRLAIFIIGLVILVSGSLLRRHCFRMLGKDFRGVVTVRDDQPVIERGAYRYLRHPSYTAALLLHLGFGLAFTNWGTLVIIALGAPPLFLYRIHVEERALASRLGAPYVAYMARTRRLIPGVW